MTHITAQAIPEERAVPVSFAEQPRRLESIHILRGFAAFSVMMCHFTYADINFRDKLPGFSGLFQFGYLGVWIFFVISGFLFRMRCEA